MVARPIQIRTTERKDFKHCRFKWYLRWRKGYKPRKGDATALQFGRWIHEALEQWYMDKHTPLLTAFDGAIEATMVSCGVNSLLHDELDTYRDLGLAMLTAYERAYTKNRVEALAAEIPLEVCMAVDEHVVVYKMKLDLLYVDVGGLIWIMEHKTASAWRVDHLTIDDQATAYLALAEDALKRKSYIRKSDRVHGMMYDFLKKAEPDTRPTNERGEALNGDGTVSKRQSGSILRRIPIVKTSRSRELAKHRMVSEITELANATLAARAGGLSLDTISKSADIHCSTMCEFFQVCLTHEQGSRVDDMLKAGFTRSDPYDY